MQAQSHRIFNITLATNLVVCCSKQHLTETLVIASGIVLCSSLPDTIEKLGLKHRGISHSLIMYCLLCCLTYVGLVSFPWVYWEYFCLLGILAGCICHVIADSCSKNGIKVFNRPIKLNLYRTANTSEKIFLFLFVLINVLLMTWLAK